MKEETSSKSKIRDGEFDEGLEVDLLQVDDNYNFNKD